MINRFFIVFLLVLLPQVCLPQNIRDNFSAYASMAFGHQLQERGQYYILDEFALPYRNTFSFSGSFTIYYKRVGLSIDLYTQSHRHDVEQLPTGLNSNFQIVKARPLRIYEPGVFGGINYLWQHNRLMLRPKLLFGSMRVNKSDYTTILLEMGASNVRKVTVDFADHSHFQISPTVDFAFRFSKDFQFVTAFYWHRFRMSQDVDYRILDRHQELEMKRLFHSRRNVFVLNYGITYIIRG